MDAISIASKNVSMLMNRKLEMAPVPIKSIRRQKYNNGVDCELYKFLQPVNIVTVYEIWQVFLDRNNSDIECVYVIITGDNTSEGYKNGDWSNIEYKGFYTTPEEALNEISGYIK